MRVVQKDEADEVREAHGDYGKGRHPSAVSLALARGEMVYIEGTHKYALVRGALLNKRSYLRRRGFNVRCMKKGDGGYLWAEEEK